MKNLKTISSTLTKTALALAAAAWMFAGLSTTVFAYPETEGKVTVDTAKIRESTSTSSGVKKTVDRGTTVIIIDEETDSSGTLWYKIKKDDVTGYIRSDLLEKGAVIETSDTSEETGGQQVQQTVPGVDPMPAQYAQISVKAGKMRAGASTGDSIVTTLEQGTQVVVSGSRQGSDGKLWYYVATTDGQEGYIRNDLVTLGDLLPQDDPEPVETAADEPGEEEPAATPYVNNDYEVVYTDDGSGQDVWYLYDHQNNSRVKLEELLKYVDSEAQLSADAEKTAKTLKVVLILVSIFLLIAIVAIVILALKLRDVYYESYGDDDDDDDDDEDDDDDDDDEDERPVRRRQTPSPSPEQRERRPQRQVAREYGSADEGVRRERRPEPSERRPERSDRRPAPATERRPRESAPYDDRQNGRTDGADRRPAQRKTKNFLIDDDDFEFEFLNMDDKK